MSLINDKQRDNAQQPSPTIKPLPTPQQPASVPQQPAPVAPDVEYSTVGSGQEFQPTLEQPEIPEQPETQEQQQPSPFDFSLSPDQSSQSPTFVPKDPLKLIQNNTGAPNIWQSIPDDKSPYASEILQTLKPTTYDNSRINSDAAALNAKGIAGVNTSMDNYSRDQQRALAAEAEVKKRASSRLANANIPRQSQPWYSVVGQAFNDVLFGSKQSQEEAERSVVNPFKLQYGKQGAGVGGWLKYVLSTPLNASVGLVADWRQGQVDTMVKAGVPRERAQALVSGEAWVDPMFWRKFGLQQDWSKTQGRSATLDAVVRGESRGDLNDPKGSNKGVFYRAARPTRTAQETEAARLGKYDVFNVGSIGQAIKDDPVGASYEILANILDPVGNKIGDIVGAGIRGVAKAKPVPKAQGISAQSVSTPPPQKPQRLLPPGKVTGIPVEQQLQELFGKNTPTPPRKPGEARLPPAQQLLQLPYTPPRVLINSGKPVTAIRKVNEGLTLGRVPMRAELETPVVNTLVGVSKQQALPQTGVITKATSSDVELTPLQMSAELDLRMLPGWEDDTIEFVPDAKFEPSTSAAALPTKAPRVYDGDFRVVQKALPPAIDNVADVIPEAIVGTPSEVVFRVGIGKPSADPIVFADEINISGIDDTIADEASKGGLALEELEMEALQKRTDLTDGEYDRLQKLMDANASGMTVEEYKAFVNKPIEPTFTTRKKSQEEVDRNIQRNRESQGLADDQTSSNVPTPSTDLSIPALRKLSDDWMGYQKKTYGVVSTNTYEEDIAPRIADVAGNLEAGKPERSIQALVEFVSKDKTYEDVSKALGIDARKTIDDIWRTLVEAADPAKIKTKARSLLNKTPEEISDSEKLLLDKIGLNNWSGRQWVARKVDASPAKPAPAVKPEPTKPKVKTWDTRSDQPLPQLTWKKNPLASGKVRRINPQELDKLWRIDRVDAGGQGGIGSRYKDATNFINSASEPVIMSEIIVAKDGSVSFIDGRHRFASLRDQGWTEIPVVVRNSNNLPDSVRTITKASDDIPPAVPVEVLEQAAEQLASHKAVLQAPLQQLDDVFETTVDFGRKLTDELPFVKLTSDDILEAFENNAQLNLPAAVKIIVTQNYGDEIAEALFDGDYFSLSESLTQKGVDLEAFVKDVSEINNGLVESPVAIAVPQETALKDTIVLKNTIKMPAKVLHGTALADWQPNYNLSLNGSRGELGSGLYVTNRKSVAEDYAKAFISENVSPGANVSDIAPAIHELSSNFTATFSARGKLSASDPIVKALVNSLPEQLRDNVQRSIYRDKTVTYVGLINKTEASLIRSGLTPDESVLKDISNRFSNALRELGYDSVYDSKSGFGLVLDETKVTVSKSIPVSKAGSPTQAALARYNADAYAAKFYPERLTTDANLRDSAYKLLSQVESTVDEKLQKIQQEIINRGLDKQQTILPPKQTFREGISLNDSKPTTADELMSTIEPKSTNPCEL